MFNKRIRRSKIASIVWGHREDMGDYSICQNGTRGGRMFYPEDVVIIVREILLEAGVKIIDE